MILFKQIFLIIFVFFYTLSFSFAQISDNTIEFNKIKNIINIDDKKYSFEEILKYTFENNDELNSEREKTKAIESLKFKTIGANTLPNIGADLNYGKVDFEENINSIKLEDSGDLMSNRIFLQQPLFKSGRTVTQIGMVNKQIEIQYNQLYQKEQEILFSTIMATVNLLKTKQIYELSLKNEESLKSSYKYVAAKREVGRTTIYELSLAEARYNSAKTNTIIAATDFLNARTLFLKITKLDSNEIDVNFDDIFNRGFNYSEKFDEILEKTLNKNPQYAIAKQNYELNKNNLKFAKTNFLPELYLNAELSKTEKTELINQKDASISLNLKIPIFQSGTEYAGHKEASHLLNQSKFDLNNIKDTLINQTITTYDEFLSSKSLVATGMSYRQASMLTLNNVILEEKVGRTTIVDILDRRKEYFDTEILLLNYKTNVIKYYYTLKALMGELNINNMIN